MAANSAEELVVVLNALDVPKDALGYHRGEDGKNYAVLSFPHRKPLVEFLVELNYPHNGDRVGIPNETPTDEQLREMGMSR